MEAMKCSAPWEGGGARERASLDADVRAEVCVVGAGIAGLTTAYLLQRTGRSVVVLDDGPIGGGETGRTSAHLSSALDDRFVALERLHGLEGARHAAASHVAAIDEIERIAGEEEIECDFARVDGYLFTSEPSAERARETLHEELAAAERAGLAGVELVARFPLPGFDSGPCLRFPRQARFEPLRYLTGLASAFERRGGRLYTGSHADRIAGGADAHVVTHDGRRVSCAAIVVATNTPVNDRFSIHAKQAPYSTYMIGARVLRGTMPDVLLWDTEDPYHYVRLLPGKGSNGAAGNADYLLIGGEDHKTAQAEDRAERFRRLEGWARVRFPSIASVDYRWTGQVMEPCDGLAFIGRNPADQDNVFIATGDSGHGLTHGTIAGLLIRDLIDGRANPWTDVYSPSRLRFGAAPELLRENVNVATRYASWVTPGDVADEASIAAGTGAVVRDGLKKLAVYRDEAGTLHRMSAVCPHLGCIVAWNAAASTWDCPCHGSRFECTGGVVTGPANRDLASADAGAEELRAQQE